MQSAVLGRLLVLARHDREVERHTELLEEPERAGRPGAGLMMKSHRAILVAALRPAPDDDARDALLARPELGHFARSAIVGAAEHRAVRGLESQRVEVGSRGDPLPQARQARLDVYPEPEVVV